MSYTWLGCSPDRKVYDITAAVQGLNPFRLLEIKIVKEGETDFKNVRYVDIDPLRNEKTLKKSHEYYFQVQYLQQILHLSCQVQRLPGY